MSNKPGFLLLESFEQLKLINQSVARAEEIKKSRPAPEIRNLKLAELPVEVLREIAKSLPYTWHALLRRSCRRLHAAIPRKPFPTRGDWIRLNHLGYNDCGHSPRHTWATCPCCLVKPPRDGGDPPDWIPSFLESPGVYLAGKQRADPCWSGCIEWFNEDGTLVHDGVSRCGLEMQPRGEVRWRPICRGCVARLQGLWD